VETLASGNYCPQPLRRYYFSDGVVDQLHLTDRVLQHVLLKQLKPSFPHIVHQNCFHMHEPGGVRLATEHIRLAIKKEKPEFVIRADIKSFYSSIPHYKLIADIRKIFDDPEVQRMLERVITNIIDTPRGYRNTGFGVAFRGPLSQLFSAIYLKPLDAAFDSMDVTDPMPRKLFKKDIRKMSRNFSFRQFLPTPIFANSRLLLLR
jgi:RNA-directed DNA polymerase